MNKDCPICRSEGFQARNRVLLRHGQHSVVATLLQVQDGLFAHDEAALSEAAWRKLGVEEGDILTATHPQPLESLGAVRAKLYGRTLDAGQLGAIIQDISNERYSDVELATFVAAMASQPCDRDEVTALTAAMLDAGEQLQWDKAVVADKHCIGGLPGNRTTPIVVAIAAAAGFVIPKTSSRAITSPAGTADVMETMTEVDLTIEQMRAVVEREGACLAWGGSVRLSPADDIIIRVERVLDIDSEAQLVASVLSKKLAAGATHVLLDIPVGPTAKVRSEEAGQSLAMNLEAVGERFGLNVQTALTNGSEPIGRGIGPCLEARDVLSVLRGETDAPRDLVLKSIDLAARLFAMISGNDQAAERRRAEELLSSGQALAKFLAICEGQGGFREPQTAPLRHPVIATSAGTVTHIDNRLLARAAKLAGAPAAPSAGIEMQVELGDPVLGGDPLFFLHGETPGELEYALEYIRRNADMITVTLA
jgi:thymidine phosphorylase